MVSRIPQTKQIILKITGFDSGHLQDLTFCNHFDLCSFNLFNQKANQIKMIKINRKFLLNEWNYRLNKRVKVWIEYTNHAMIFLRYSSLAFLTSALVSTFLVAKTLIFSAPLDFLIFLLSYFSAFLFGFLLGRTLNCLSLKFGSYLTKYCWLS